MRKRLSVGQVSDEPLVGLFSHSHLGREPFLMVEHRRSGVAKASHVWLVQRTQAACGLCDEHKPRVLLQRAQAACGLCTEAACGEHKPCVACVAKTSRVWLVWQAQAACGLYNTSRVWLLQRTQAVCVACVASTSRVWLVQRVQAAWDLCSEYKSRVACAANTSRVWLVQRVQATCGLCSDYKPRVACVTTTSRAWLA